MSDADEYNRRQVETGKLRIEHITRLVRFWQEAKGLDADGKAGPKTIATLAPFVLPSARCWPLPALRGGRPPSVTSAFRNADRPTHSGVDLMYARRAGDPPMTIGDGGRTANWWVPEGTPAIAAADGVIEWSGKTSTGYRCWVRHEGGYATGYFHLRNLYEGPGAMVVMGEPLGIVSDNPIDYDPDHLHFELVAGSLDDLTRNRVNPQLWLDGAAVLEAA